MARYEVYWNDADNNPRGVKCESEDVARGFIWALRKDARNTLIGGFDSERDQNLNTDEHGKSVDHLGPFPLSAAA